LAAVALNRAALPRPFPARARKLHCASPR
jgi:hypothetical protein